MTLKLDRKIKLSDMTMSYVDTLWKALIEEFNLPPLTAIIKKIIGGSLIISWLVPPQVSSVIAASYSKALGFYLQHNIARIELDGSVLYTDEEWIVSDECMIDMDMPLPTLPGKMEAGGCVCVCGGGGGESEGWGW